MKSLSKKQVQQLSDLQADLQGAAEKVESAIADFNANINELWGNLVLDELNEYNRIAKQASSFAEQIRDQIQSYYDELSEDGQQSELGNAYQEWLEDWDEASFEQIDLRMPDETDVPEFNAVEVIDELPTEPNL